MEDIYNKTNWLSNLTNITDKHRIYLIKHNITSAPKCKRCSNNVMMYTIPSNGFAKYCSPTCSRKDTKNLKNDIADVISSYDWWYDQRITQGKSQLQISTDIGISIPAVVRYLRKHKISSEDERRPNKETNEILLSYSKLYDLYITQKLKVEELAERINSSAATVSRWLNYHQIDTRLPNSYPKPTTQTQPEKDIISFIQTFYNGEIIHGASNILPGGYQLDIYLPEANFAIEYNGLQSHIWRPNAERWSGRKDQTYHLWKTKQAYLKGIFLIHIYSDEWLNKPEIIKSMIRSKIGLNQNKIPARKCIVKPINLLIKDDFLNNNHIQGTDKASIKLGLYHENILVSVMTFKQKGINKCDYDWELSRFASLQNYTVMGGFAKLLKYASQNGITGKIVSYADRRFSQGKIYQSNGFTLQAINPASYDYVPKTMDKRENRLFGTKKNFAKRGAETHRPDGIENTEWEMGLQLGYHRIFNCGTLTYIKNL